MIAQAHLNKKNRKMVAIKMAKKANIMLEIKTEKGITVVIQVFKHKIHKARKRRTRRRSESNQSLF